MEYRQKKSTDRKKALALLSERFDLLPHKAVKVERLYLDTFDWRLHAAGTRLEEIREGGATRSEWRDNTSDAVLGRVVGKAPKFAAAWPVGPLADRLKQTIKMRALLPVASVRQTVRRVEVRDRRGKLVARLSFEKSEVPASGKEKAEGLPEVVRLYLLKGFEAEGARIREVFERELGLTLARHTYLEALDALGRKPSGYSSKINVKLDPAMRSEEALRLVLGRLAQVMEQNVAGAVADVDTEFLHDYRVAVRRTRSALGQVKRAVPKATLDKIRPAFGKLGLLTGPTRDLDVYLLKFDSYAAALPAESRKALEPLKSFLAVRQREEQAKLAAYLKSAAYRTFFAKWRAELGKRWKSTAKDWRGGEPIVAEAGRRIFKIYKRILKQGAMLSPQSPPPAVHELRIACKKLRYMIEFFRSLYPAEEIEPLVASLKDLQDTLGDFQDHEVHRLELYGYANEMVKRKLAGTRTLMALGELAECLAERQRKSRGEIAGKFAAFGAPEIKGRFDALFRRRPQRSGDEDRGDLQH